MSQVGILGLGTAPSCPAAHARLRYLNLIEQFGVLVEHFKQFDQRQWRLGLAVLIA